MKKLTCFLILIFTGVSLFSQDDNWKLLRMEIGPCLHFNSLNEDNYYAYMDNMYGIENTSMQGINMKFNARFKPGVDIIFGAIAEIGRDDYTDSGWNPGSTNSTDYVLNGGGVYAGLNPHTRGEHFGLDVDLAVGMLAYKEYISVFNNVSEPYIDKHEKKSSAFGSIVSLGFYLRGKTLGLSPEFQLIMAGGNNGGFLFYGFYVPLTISF